MKKMNVRVLDDITREENKVIKERIRVLEGDLKKKEKKYMRAMSLAGISIFEYDLKTDQLFLSQKDAELYGLPNTVENGVETFIEEGIIEKDSADAFRGMYKKIQNGEPLGMCYVNTKDLTGVVREYKLILSNFYDNEGNPTRAIGVTQNISEIRRLEKEIAFGRTLVLGKQFVWEANITKDYLTKSNTDWQMEADILGGTTYSEMIKKIGENMVASDEQIRVVQKLSKDNIISLYEKGESILTFSYKRKNITKGAAWYQATINIIMDQVSGDIFARCYILDIDEKKKKEETVEEAQRLYETMISKVLRAYKVNISKNYALEGHENRENLFGIQKTTDYSKMVSEFSKKLEFKDDERRFTSTFDRNHVLECFHNGDKKLSCEYRKPCKNGNVIWVCCTLNLYEDPDSGDVRGYSYVEDIDKEKRKEIELSYKAEHDLLTDLYNKATIEKQITQFLETDEGASQKHAFLMVDIDYFKTINDNFGHVFGDAVLSQVSGKIKSLFREGDIIGRMGGDEFGIFMKNIYNEKTAALKADEVCSIISQTYYQRSVPYKISASIGVAIYNEHGKSYSELYLHADSALYASKNNGKNQHTIFNGNMRVLHSKEKAIRSHALLEHRGFEENMTDYLLRILYESKDMEATIYSVLNLVGKHLNVSRIYIFEDSEDGKCTTNTFEWCNTGVKSCIEEFQKMLYSDLGDYKSNFDEDGIFCLLNVESAEPKLQKILKLQNVMSMLRFSIVRFDKFVGFVGFDQCDYSRIPSRKEVSDCYNISKILGIFLTEMRIQQSDKV